MYSLDLAVVGYGRSFLKAVYVVNKKSDNLHWKVSVV